MHNLYFHTDIPQYVREAITQHLEGITFSTLYIVTGLDIVPVRDSGYSFQFGEFWEVDVSLEIPGAIGASNKPGLYPTRVSITFRIPVA